MPHIHEKIDFTATVFIVHKNKVLLRKHDKYKMWLGVGGHIELDEDPTQAAVREVKEEVGLDVTLIGDVNKALDSKTYTELLPPRFMNIHNINDTHKHLDLIYFARSESDDVKPEGADLSNEWQWLSQSDLEKNTIGVGETIRLYAIAALKEAAK